MYEYLALVTSVTKPLLKERFLLIFELQKKNIVNVQKSSIPYHVTLVFPQL